MHAQLWSDAFAEENGRRPDRRDVNNTGILWLVRHSRVTESVMSLTCVRFADRQVHHLHDAEAKAACAHPSAAHQLGHAGSRGNSAAARARRAAGVFCELATNRRGRIKENALLHLHFSCTASAALQQARAFLTVQLGPTCFRAPQQRLASQPVGRSTLNARARASWSQAHNSVALPSLYRLLHSTGLDASWRAVWRNPPPAAC